MYTSKGANASDEVYVMKRNVGRPDQIVRIIVGVGLFLVPSLIAVGAWGTWLLCVVGAVLIVTAVFSFCPIYAALGLSTRPRLKT